MDVDTWVAFFWLALVSSLAPGPAVLLVVAHALRCGAWRATGATLGILSANACFFALAGCGVGALLQANPMLYEFLRWGGVALVAWLGVQCLRSRGLAAARGAVETTDHGAGPTFAALYGRGFLLQFANPKALIFFTTLLPPFLAVGPNAWPLPWQVLALGVTSVVPEFFVLLGYALLSGALHTRLQSPTWVQWLDRTVGVMLLLVAGWVALRG